jgi:hypothetical protein
MECKSHWIANLAITVHKAPSMSDSLNVPEEPTRLQPIWIVLVNVRIVGLVSTVLLALENLCSVQLGTGVLTKQKISWILHVLMELMATIIMEHRPLDWSSSLSARNVQMDSIAKLIHPFLTSAQLEPIMIRLMRSSLKVLIFRQLLLDKLLHSANPANLATSVLLKV